MFEEVEARRRRLDAFRPFGAGMKERLDAVFEPWFIYGSNAIEGNTLTYGDTVYLIREGKLPAGKTEAEYLEVKGQQAAYAYLHQAVEGRFPLSEKLIREFHHLLTEKLEFEKYRPGQYKDRDNQVRLPDGKVFPYVSHVDTPAAMQALVDWHNGEAQSLHPLERAAGLHYRFILIHPFRDGNGRTARLLANLTLLQAGYVMTVFRADERRRQYLDALRAVDTSVPLEELRPDNPTLNLFPFVTHVEQEMLWSYDLALDVVEGRAPLTAEDLVRRFERLDKRALAAAGIATDERARLEIMAQSVELLIAHVAGLLSEMGKRLNAGWDHLRLRQDQRIGPAPEVLFHASDDLNIDEKTIQSAAGFVSVSITPVGRLAHLEVPVNSLEILVYAEPHALTVAAVRGLLLGDRKAVDVVSRKVPIDSQSWNLAEIDGLVVGELNLFLSATEKEIETLNRGRIPAG